MPAPWSMSSSAGAGNAWPPDPARRRPGRNSFEPRSSKEPVRLNSGPTGPHPGPWAPKAAPAAVSAPRPVVRHSENRPRARYAAWRLLIGIDCRLASSNVIFSIFIGLPPWYPTVATPDNMRNHPDPVKAGCVLGDPVDRLLTDHLNGRPWEQAVMRISAVILGRGLWSPWNRELGSPFVLID